MNKLNNLRATKDSLDLKIDFLLRQIKDNSNTIEEEMLELNSCFVCDKKLSGEEFKECKKHESGAFCQLPTKIAFRMHKEHEAGLVCKHCRDQVFLDELRKRKNWLD